MNDDYFISGSIDGKVRIWAIDCCNVVYWAETRNIITAVSYRPDGQVWSYYTMLCVFFFLIFMTFECKVYQLVIPLLVIQGGIVGSIAGTCHFFHLTGMPNSWKKPSLCLFFNSTCWFSDICSIILVYIALAHGFG